VTFVFVVDVLGKITARHVVGIVLAQEGLRLHERPASGSGGHGSLRRVVGARVDAPVYARNVKGGVEVEARRLRGAEGRGRRGGRLVVLSV
jgi:hypothetical protein